MAAGPDGGLYVYVSTDNRSVVALLDTTGEPRPGWPVALDDPFCEPPAPAADGSIRIVCGQGYPDSPVYAFAPDGRPLAGWPVRLPGVQGPRVVGDDLYAMGFVRGIEERVTALRLVSVAPDGSLRTGRPYEVPAVDETTQALIGPDGKGYFLDVQEAPGPPLVTEITALDMGGVREGWLILTQGGPSGLGFGPDGHIYITQTQAGEGPSRILAFDREGRPLPIGSDELPVVATSAFAGNGPLAGTPPPLVADDGTTFLVSEDRGTTVYGIDPVGQVMPGWPYRDAIGLQWSPDSGGVGGGTWRSTPAIGPGNVLYLLHPPRANRLGGSIVAIGPDGRVRPGWPVVLTRAGSVFQSVVVGPDGTAHALAVEPEVGGGYSASILTLAPDSTVLYTTTIIEP